MTPQATWREAVEVLILAALLGSVALGAYLMGHYHRPAAPAGDLSFQEPPADPVPTTWPAVGRLEDLADRPVPVILDVPTDPDGQQNLPGFGEGEPAWD